MSIYTDNGYASRKDYFESLAEEYEVDIETIYALYDILGDAEAFDGLITAVQDITEDEF